MPELAVEKCARYHDRAMASFIIDDVAGQSAEDAAAFKRFSAWVAESGIKGECSAIPGLRRAADESALPLHPDYCAEVASASAQHLDAYMEVMTHRYLYDFSAGRMRSDGPHEGVWLLSRTPAREDYRNYLSNIAQVAARGGFKHAGLTIPGCGCADCVALKKSMRLNGLQATDFNSEVFFAMLELLRERRFSGTIFGLFVGTTDRGPADVQVMLEDGELAVYDTPPGVRGDHFGRWENDRQFLDLDQYITADGSSGRLAELIALSSRTLIYYGHWQSLRPDNGVGYDGFREIASRLKKHHGDRIVWMRPTEIAAYRHAERHTRLTAGTKNTFSLSIPFMPPHELTFRIRGSAGVRIKTPEGKILDAIERLPGEACALFDILPQNGTYEILDT